jgi:hypothetical protein
MRLEAIQTLVRDELEEMRPKPGDAVNYEGQKHIVEQCGMKFYVLHLESNPRVGLWVKHRAVTRWIPEDDDPQPDKKPMDLSQIFPHLGPRD